MAISTEVQIDPRTANQDYLVATGPAQPTPIPEIVEALRTITQLDGLTDEEYTWLAANGTERMGCEGALIFREGEPTSRMNFILKGEIHVRRQKSGPMALFIGRAGQMTGLLPFSRMKGYGGDGYTIGPSWVLDIHKDLFPAMLVAIPSMGQRSVSALLDRVREVTRMEQQAEKLSALGKLAANLAHELNNPASAAQRSAASLFTELRQYGQQSYRLGALSAANTGHAKAFKEWIARTRTRMAEFAFRPGTEVSPLAQSDREDLFLRWLEEHNIPDPWTIAPTLAETSVGIDQLDELAAISTSENLPLAVSTFANSLGVERMAETIVESTGRIFDLISAIKDYSYMDQAPIQDIDLAQSLENTLVMFASRLSGIAVETNFDPMLPPISAYGSELNQIWTALIENALDAMPMGGVLRLTTKLNGQMAFVEIVDNGVGIPVELTSRVFEPFFTTKAPGRGLGLGLDVAQRIVTKHSGFIMVESAPGRTCFQVRLPIDQAEAY